MKSNANRLYIAAGFVWTLLLSVWIYLSLTPPFPQNDGDISFFFSENRGELKYALGKGIKKAKSSVFLSSFGITDEEILSLLEEKEEQGLDITICFDPKTTNILPGSEKIKRVPHVGSGLMHQKVVAIDKNLIFLGSTNITSFSLQLHGNLIAAVYSNDLYQAICANTHFSKDRLTYYPMPKEAKEAKKRLLNLINGAKKEIHLAIYTLTHKELIEALIKAKDRGVKVAIYIDRGMANGVCRKAIDSLLKASMFIKHNIGFGLLHHKCALIDNTFVFGSANWTKAAFGKNKEYIITVENLTAKDRQKIEPFFKILYLSCQQMDR